MWLVPQCQKWRCGLFLYIAGASDTFFLFGSCHSVILLGCSSHHIRESKLEEVVLAALQEKIQQISGLEERLDEINEIPKNQRRLGCEPIRLDSYTQKKMTFFFDPDGLPLELHE